MINQTALEKINTILCLILHEILFLQRFALPVKATYIHTHEPFGIETFDRDSIRDPVYRTVLRLTNALPTTLTDAGITEEVCLTAACLSAYYLSFRMKYPQDNDPSKLRPLEGSQLAELAIRDAANVVVYVYNNVVSSGHVDYMTLPEEKQRVLDLLSCAINRFTYNGGTKMPYTLAMKVDGTSSTANGENLRALFHSMFEAQPSPHLLSLEKADDEIACEINENRRKSKEGFITDIPFRAVTESDADNESEFKNDKKCVEGLFSSILIVVRKGQNWTSPLHSIEKLTAHVAFITSSDPVFGQFLCNGRLYNESSHVQQAKFPNAPIGEAKHNERASVRKYFEPLIEVKEFPKMTIPNNTGLHSFKEWAASSYKGTLFAGAKTLALQVAAKGEQAKYLNHLFPFSAVFSVTLQNQSKRGSEHHRQIAASNTKKTLDEVQNATALALSTNQNVGNQIEALRTLFEGQAKAAMDFADRLNETSKNRLNLLEQQNDQLQRDMDDLKKDLNSKNHSLATVASNLCRHNLQLKHMCDGTHSNFEILRNSNLSKESGKRRERTRFDDEHGLIRVSQNALWTEFKIPSTPQANFTQSVEYDDDKK